MAKICATSLARLLLACCVVCVCASATHSANTHGRPDMMGEMQAWFGDGFTPYVASGCLPAVPSSSLTFASFACTGYVRGALADLVYVTQPALGLTLANTNGLHWVALHRDTSSAVAGWTRRAGSHYLFQQAATQPASPVGGLVIAQATVAGGVITAVQSVAQARSPVSAALTLINVMDYGATANGITDDTAAIQAAIAAIPSVPGTQGGSGCLYFPLPKTPGGFYKVTATLDFSNKFNMCMKAPGPYGHDQTDSVGTHNALIQWYGSASANVILLHNTYGGVIENISISCRDIASTRGLAFGPDATASSLVRGIKVDSLEISHCDLGLRLGDLAANGPDIAGNIFSNVSIHHNASEGVSQNSGNGVGVFYNLLAFCNGATPIGGRKGANVYAEGGEIDLFGYIGIGEGVCKPADGDVYVASTGIHIFGAWSEVHGPFVTASGSPAQASVITAVKHYTATMTDTLVPKSVVWASSNTLDIDGFYFANIEVNAGTNTLVVDHGTKFYAGAQHDLSVVPTFTGTAISGQLAYAGMPGTAQRARLASGRPPRTDIGSTFSSAPALEMAGRESETMTTYCTSDVNGDNCNTLAVQRGGDSVGAMHWIGNGYFAPGGGGVIHPIKAGFMSKFRWSGGDAALGQPVLELVTDLSACANPAACAAETRLSPGVRFFAVSYVATGTGTAPVVTVGPQRLTWTSAPPTMGVWAIGDVAHHNAPASGQPSGWVCTVAGMPGTWKALANVP